MKAALRLGRAEGAAEVGAARPFQEWRFVRGAVPAWHWNSEKELGIFGVAGDVQDRMRLGEEQDRRLASTLRWFNGNGSGKSHSERGSTDDAIAATGSS